MIKGIHHVTAIAGDAQRNVDFYAGVLGLRLVKKTINYDDPGTYHLYYGDGAGRPGTILTFFPWPNTARRGRVGTGQVTRTTLAIPVGARGFWHARLDASGRNVTESGDTLLFDDPDGLPLALREVSGAPGDGSGSGTVEASNAIRGIDSVTLGVADTPRTRAFLSDPMGFMPAGAGADRFHAGQGEAFETVEMAEPPPTQRGAMGIGVVHHVAFRVADDAAQTRWLEKLQALDLNVSPVMDRQYFHSIYFREPGGVLFEIATDPPGFTADGEMIETLGTRLMLPEWLEANRSVIETALPPLRAPS